MPTTYAHYYFGNEVIKILPKEYQDIINNNRDIYNFGVHGPDIFFYYKGYKKNDIVEYGSNLHKEEAKNFFSKCKEVYHKYPEKDAMMSYIIGFLTHFTFDSTAHSYIERKREYANITHNKVETEYDRYLIIKSGLAPKKYDRTITLKPNKELAKIISYFFKYDEKICYESLRWQVLLLKTLNASSDFKRNLLYNLMDKLKVSANNKDLILGRYEDPICADSNLRIDKLKAKAYDLFPSLFNNLINYFEDKEELDPYFNHDFDRWPNYNELPVLSFEEEKEYKL